MPSSARRHEMTLSWPLLWFAVAVIIAMTVLVSVNSMRVRRSVNREVRSMWAHATEALPIDRTRLSALPAPARVYLEKALGHRATAIRTVRFRHGGTFRTSLEGAWQPIRGEQYESSDPPGFIWWGRLRSAPAVWVDARDRSVAGAGRMFVSLESTFTLFDRSGTEIDQGALLRLLSDMVLFPSAFLDGRYVTWDGIDDTHARATLRVGTQAVEGVFEFGANGLPLSFSADRYYDTGKGRAELQPWSGEYRDYREVDGILVPHRFIGYWHVVTGRIPYVDFQLEPPQFDAAAPF